MKRHLIILYAFLVLLLILTGLMPGKMAAATLDSVLWQQMKHVGKLFREGRNDSAMSEGREALHLAEQKGDLRAEVLLCAVMSSQAYSERQYQESYGLTMKGEKAWIALNETNTTNLDMVRNVATLYTYMALAADELGKAQEARRAARIGLEWVKRSDDGIQIIAGTNMLSDILLREDTTVIAKNDAATSAGISLADNPLNLHDTVTQSLQKISRPSDDVQNNAKATVGTLQTENITTQDGPSIYLIVVVMLAVIAIMVCVLWLRQRRRERQMRQQMAEQYLEGQEQERSRLARELHDSVSNQLLAVEMKLSTDGLTPQTLQLLNESREQVRRVSHELLPPEFDHATLNHVLASYVESLRGLKRWELSFVCSPAEADWTVIPVKIALEVYRIVQEAVANIMKHAHATTIAIGLHLDDSNGLELTVSDNGIWKTDADVSAGAGLRTMRQRANTIGGHLEIQRHHYGNTVSLTVASGKKS